MLKIKNVYDNESNIIKKKYRTKILFSDVLLENTICKNYVISDLEGSVINKTFKDIESWNL